MIPTYTPEVGEHLRLGEAAALIPVHPDTLRNWADEGKVPFIRTPGGQRRFRRSDIEALLGRTAVNAATANTLPTTPRGAA